MKSISFVAALLRSNLLMMNVEKDEIASLHHTWPMLELTMTVEKKELD